MSVLQGIGKINELYDKHQFKILYDKVMFQVNQMWEFRNSIDSAYHLSESTRQNYLQNYKKLKASINNKITDCDELFIIKTLRNFDCSPKTKSNMLCVVLLIRRYFKLPVDKLLFYRGYKNQNNDIMGGELWLQMNNRKVQQKIDTDKNLPKKQELVTFCYNLYKQKKYVDFVINYLLINFGFRNKDLNMNLTKDKKVISRSMKNIKKYTENYIYPTNSYIWLVVNDYKTATTYGKKKIIVRNRWVLNAVKAIMEKQNKLLINPKEKTDVTPEGIGRIIQDMTYKKMGETKYFKTIVKDIFDNYSDIEDRRRMLKLYSESRGTHAETIINNYATGIPI